jgi:hypothetical protein
MTVLSGKATTAVKSSGMHRERRQSILVEIDTAKNAIQNKLSFSGRLDSQWISSPCPAGLVPGLLGCVRSRMS